MRFFILSEEIAETSTSSLLFLLFFFYKYPLNTHNKIQDAWGTRTKLQRVHDRSSALPEPYTDKHPVIYLRRNGLRRESNDRLNKDHLTDQIIF